MLTQVILHGHLAQAFGRDHHFKVDTPREALCALAANFPNFRAHLLHNSRPGYQVVVDDRELSLEEVCLYRRPKVIRIVPHIEGEGGNALTRILIGAALIYLTVASYGTLGAEAAATAGVAEGTTVSATTAGGMGLGLSYGTSMSISSMLNVMGWSLVMGGVAQMLAGDPKLPQTSISSSEEKPSYIYDGPVNTSAQGVPIPIVYGMMEVGSIVGSFGLSANEVIAGSGTDDPDPSGYRFTGPGTSVRIERWSDDEDLFYDYPVTTTGGTAPHTITIEEQDALGLWSIVGTNLRFTPPVSGLPARYEGQVGLRTQDSSGTPKIARRGIQFSVRTEKGDTDRGGDGR